MAQTVVTALVGDLDGSAAEETVEFAYRGVSYEIDLSQKNTARFERAMAPLPRARPTQGAHRCPLDGPVVVQVHKDASAVRAWAQANGYQVSSRGRIPWGVREAYQAVNAADQVVGIGGRGRATSAQPGLDERARTG